MYQTNSPQSIRALFASIAPHYDKANCFASLGLHYLWNHRLVASIGHPTHLLDLCAGTGEIGCRFLAREPHAHATLVDFCPQMLEVAQKKGTRFAERIDIVCADAMSLPFPAARFDAATIAYGIRNVQQPIRCFQEVFRVLKPQGVFSILELTRPSLSPLRWAHRLYTETMLPLFGKYVSKNPQAYRYLAKSVQQFISPQQMRDMLQAVGFRSMKESSFFCGTATILTCSKPA